MWSKYACVCADEYVFVRKREVGEIHLLSIHPIRPVRAAARAWAFAAIEVDIHPRPD